MAPIIEIRNLSKIYRPEGAGAGDEVHEVRALDSISLIIERGDFVAIVGQSGSGKSTLMQILGLLDRNSSGQYLLDGEDISAFDDATLALLRSQKIGFIFQFFNLLPRTTATDNVALPMLYAGDPSPTGRAQELLKWAGLETRLNHKPHQLSGGQQQRVAIARALANRPQIIFADEPTGNISSQQADEILKKLEELNEQGVTIILVTHESDIAARARRVITLRDGKLLSDERLRPTPANIPVAPPLKSPERGFPWQRVKENLRMAWVALTLNKLRTALATLGIVIGISSVVAMVAVGKGAQSTIEQQLSSLGTNVLTIWPQQVRGSGVAGRGRGSRRFTVEDYDAIRRLISDTSALRNVGAAVFGSVSVSYGAKNSSTRVVGATSSYQEMQNATLTAGYFFSDEQDRARERLALVGQTVVKNLFEPGFNPIGSLIRINRVEFKIIGVLSAKGANSFQDADDQIIIPLHTAMFRVVGAPLVENLTVSVKDDSRIEEATRQLESLLRERREIKPNAENDFAIRSLNEIREAVNKSTQAISSLLAAIASISLLVGGIGIMNVMLVSVKERTKEIGLRKALGARKKDVLLQFLVESVMICILGGVIGLGLGYALSGLASWSFGWDVMIPASAAFVAVIFSMIVGIVFGIWPAKQAANLSPIEALRIE
jgi:macrolide transport system ATP-binding/permease protein